MPQIAARVLNRLRVADQLNGCQGAAHECVRQNQGRPGRAESVNERGDGIILRQQRVRWIGQEPSLLAGFRVHVEDRKVTLARSGIQPIENKELAERGDSNPR